MITRILFFFGIFILLTEITALVLNCKKTYGKNRIAASKKYFSIALCLGALFSILSLFIKYPFSDTIKICGFPFAAAAFQYENGCWVDYVGPLTGFYMLLNCLTFFLIPQLVLSVITKLKEKNYK